MVMNRLVVNRRIEMPGHVLYDDPTPDSDSKVVYNAHYRDNIKLKWDQCTVEEYTHRNFCDQIVLK